MSIVHSNATEHLNNFFFINSIRLTRSEGIVYSRQFIKSGNKNSRGIKDGIVGSIFIFRHIRTQFLRFKICQKIENYFNHFGGVINASCRYERRRTAIKKSVVLWNTIFTH